MFFRLLPITRRINQRTVLWGLVLGFGMVVLLLGLAGLLAVRDTRAIRRSAAGLVKEQLLIARLLHEVQVEENTLTEVLHRLVRTPQTLDRSVLLRELGEADQTLARLAMNAKLTRKAPIWKDLETTAREFSNQARQALDQDDPISEKTISDLFNTHDDVVKLTDELLADSAQHLAEADQKIEQQSRDLADESALLLSSCLVLATLCA
ncbi:MAG: hypothetical protein ABL974_01720, partial [Prosthecobacter sp.]